MEGEVALSEVEPEPGCIRYYYGIISRRRIKQGRLLTFKLEGL